MKILRVGLVVLIFCAFFGATPVHASMPTAPSVEKPKSPVIIAGFSLTGARLGYVQLRNTGDVPVDITGWEISYKIKVKDRSDALVVIDAGLKGLIAPGKFLVVAETSAVSGVDFSYELTSFPADALEATKITVTSPAYEDVTAVPDYDSKNPACLAKPENNFWARHISDSTGSYTSSYDCFSPSDAFVLESDPLYEFPQKVDLQVAEILANPRSCSPLDRNAACGDYVKLYNPTGREIDLSNLRLRVGYQGQSATASNTYLLSGKIKPGHYAAITKSADGRPLSVTNSGGYIWLEDVYGIKPYSSTVQQYTDASAESKKGLAWAYDETDGRWKWTAQPTPGDSPSVFVAPPEKTRKSAAVKSLVPCKPGQYRSTETNRCRSLASTMGSSLTPCKPGQERNLETNRCRKIGTAASTLKPCKANQERNPDTNRCRNKTSSIPGAAFAVEPVKEAGKAFAGWWALGGVGALALGYGAWEWRGEALGAIRKTGAFLMGRK